MGRFNDGSIAAQNMTLAAHALATADLSGFVRCTPIDFLNSSFKEQGADSRQHLEMN